MFNDSCPSLPPSLPYSLSPSLHPSDFGPDDEDIAWTPPYVSAIPEVASIALNRLDHFLVLASDGLWDVFENEEVVSLVAGWREEGREGGAIATLLVEAALERVADSLGMSVEELGRVKEGRERRRKHDDITVVVVLLEEERKGECPLEGSQAWEEEISGEVDDFVYPEDEGGAEGGAEGGIEGGGEGRPDLMSLDEGRKEL
jgi:serine/threonine protein phosphatase PrpC